MSSATLSPTVRPVLADLVPSVTARRAVTDALLVGTGTLFVAAFAQLSITLPFTPVPITLSSFAVLLTGAALGSRRGALSMALYILTVVTVLALPINIIAGFFGMNVGGIPFSADPEGFWILVALVATFTLFAGRWAFRKRQDY